MKKNKNIKSKINLKNRYPGARNTYIKRLLSHDRVEQFAFSSEQKAINQLEIFKKIYTTTRVIGEEEISKTEMRIWVRYLKHFFPNVQRKAISKGEYVHVKIIFDELDSFYRFDVEIVNIDPTFHPERGPRLGRNPNMGGHGLFRDLLKGEKKEYESLHEIVSEFERATEYWPKSVYPLPGNKITAQFYVNNNGHRKFPKYIFEPVGLPNGNYYVKHYPNNFERNLDVGYKPLTFNIFI